MAGALSPGRSQRSLTLPLLLIAVGLLFLLQNLGILPWGLWGTLWRFWPIVLVLVGIELIFRRTRPGLALLMALAVVAIVAVAAVSAAGRTLDFSGPASGTVVGDRLVEPLAGVEQAAIELKFGAGEIDLGSLSEDSPNLVEGEIGHEQGQATVKDRQRRNGEARLLLENRARVWFPFGDRIATNWDLRLSPRIPLDLRLQTGASQVHLDLSRLKVTRLRIDAGASEVRVGLPRSAGTTRAAIKAGAADVTVEVPEGVAARIRVKSAIGSVSVDERRFPKSDTVYVSPNYDVATDRVELEIDTGAASVTIR